MNLAHMLYGEPTTLADYLDTTEEELGIDELKALLTNLCRRVAALEKRSADKDEAAAETGKRSRRGGDAHS